VQKARARDNLQAASKLTRRVHGRGRLVSDPPLLVPIDELVGESGARHSGDYYVRQLRDCKGSAEVESMTPQMLADYGFGMRSHTGPRACPHR
jgi:hypothetical protein